jgi:hypothetical protein
LALLLGSNKINYTDSIYLCRLELTFLSKKMKLILILGMGHWPLGIEEAVRCFGFQSCSNCRHWAWKSKDIYKGTV